LGVHLRLDRFLNGIVVLGLCAGLFARVVPACVASPYLCLMSWGDGLESPCEERMNGLAAAKGEFQPY